MEKPSPKCCIDKCLTHMPFTFNNIKYYLFPNDANLAAMWEKKIKDNVKDSSYKYTEGDVLCSLHFSQTLLIPTTRELIDHALPDCFVIFNDSMLPMESAAKTSPPTGGPKLAGCIPSHSKSAVSGSKCCINSCSTRFDECDSKIHGFKFPQNASERQKWICRITFCQKIVWDESVRICELHFSHKSFDANGRLKNDAIPSIFTENDDAVRKSKFHANAENQSMIQHEPIAERLPERLPKAEYRIGAQNIVLSSASTCTTREAELLPVPGLNKLDKAAHVEVMNAQQIPMRQKKLVIIQKVKRPGELPNTSTGVPGQNTQIAKLQSIVDQTNFKSTTLPTVKCTNTTIAPSPVQSLKRIKINTDPDFMDAINEIQSNINSNENVYEYPRLLHERILKNEQQNHDLELEVAELSSKWEKLKKTDQ